MSGRARALFGWRPFAARRRGQARLQAVVAALERGAAAAEAERQRLAEATAVAHRALAVLHDRLVELAGHPARIDALIDRAGAELTVAASSVGARAAERVAAEIAPARVAAEAHASSLRASIDRMRGEGEALAGAERAASVLVELATTTQGGLHAALDALSRRSEGAVAAADRIDAPAPTRRRAAAR